MIRPSDSACTPRWLTDLLPEVDLDPCSNPRSTVRAGTAYSLESGDDGLFLPWRGKVFINPPYSKPMPWIGRAIGQLVEGWIDEAIFLVKCDPSTRWWAELTKWHHSMLWLFGRRIQFDEHPDVVLKRMERGGPRRSSNNFASAILHLRRGVIPAVSLPLHEVATRWVRQ